MSTRHDARLLPVAAGAWVAAFVATGGAATAALVASLFLALAAGAVLVLGVRPASKAVLVLRASHGIRAAAAVCLLTGVAGAVVGIVAGARLEVQQDYGDALIGAGATDAWITVDSQPSVVRGFDGSEQWRVAATVTAWRPRCQDGQGCDPWLSARAPVTVVLDKELTRGLTAQVVADWDESTWGSQVAIAWDAQHIADGSAGFLSRWRERFHQATESLAPEMRGLVRGMAVGDTSSMTKSQDRAMRVAGLAHLTAVSGAHFAIVVMACVSVLGALRAPRAIKAGGVLVLAGTFAAVVGPDPSVVRALTMATAVALALAWGRPARGCAALCVGVSVLLVLDPWLSRSIGFTMSVLAVTAIVLWSPRIAAMASAVMTPALARVVAIPIAAQAAVTPLLIVMEPGIGPYAVVANLAAGVAVLPTMLACAATLAVAAFSVSFAAVMAPVAGWLAGGIAHVARVSAQAPGSWISWPAGPLGVGLAAGVSVLLVLATVRMRLQYRVVAVILVVALIGAATSYADPARAPIPVDWQVAACDVGQGDMLLLRTGPHAAVVIDTGAPGQGAGECLRRHRIDHVPLLILTHPHLDHDGAVNDVIEVARVDQGWVSADGEGGMAALTIEAAGARVRVPDAGEYFAAGDTVIEVVSDFHEQAEKNVNDASIIVRAQVGGTTVMSLGDLEVAGQRALLARLNGAAPFDVVKVAHHGSRHQLPALIEAIDARVALVSVGADNRHGHPAPSALELYGTYAAAVLRTDECGDVHVSTVGGQLRWSDCP